MSRVITDDSLLTWEVFASGGRFGLPQPAKIIFQCVSHPDWRARFVEHGEGNASAERALQGLPDATLLKMLRGSVELD